MNDLRSPRMVPPALKRAQAAGVCVAFTSALQGDGVSFVVNNLARQTSGQGSSRVAVLNAQELLDRFETGSRAPVHFRKTTEHWVLQTAEAGEPVSGELSLAGAEPSFALQVQSLLQHARSHFDVVLLDCPSLQTSTLAGEIGPMIDGYVAVVRAGEARRQSVEDLSSQLGSTRVPTIGYVLNRRVYPVPRWLHKMI